MQQIMYACVPDTCALHIFVYPCHTYIIFVVFLCGHIHAEKWLHVYKGKAQISDVVDSSN